MESAIGRVESQLSQLEKSGSKGAGSIAKASLNQGGFAKTVEQSKKALDEKRAALAQTEKEYKKNKFIFWLFFSVQMKKILDFYKKLW